MSERTELMDLMIHAKVLKLRHDGYTNEQCARQLGISPLRVSVILDEAIQQLQGDSTKHAAAIRELELLRLDAATQQVMPRIENGDTSAINALLKIQDRRAKYLGLDSSIKQDTTLTIEVPWLTRDRLAYKDQIEDATVISPPPADSVQVEQRAERLDLNPWKPAPPEAGLAAILRDADKKS